MSATEQFYRDQAAGARRDAGTAELDNVRDRWLCAAAAWETMAARLASTERMRVDTDARKAAAASDLAAEQELSSLPRG